MMLKFTRIIQTFGSSPILKPPMPIKKLKPMSTPHTKKLKLQQQKFQKNTNIQQIVPSTQPKVNLSKEQHEMNCIINQTKTNEDSRFQPKKKSPVITIMGHVDHGKTTLIDYLRSSDIAGKQSGGITQKIGAFHIECHGEKITFIDTPGHQAFTNMRQRGAQMTDLVVLIVSATQGVKKQTIQIINIIKERNIPTIVAINKLDLPNADPQGIQKSIHQAGLQIQPCGGYIPVVHISAKVGTNVSLLSQLILEQTKNISAVFEGTVQGFVLEAHKNAEGQNAMTMIVQKGTVKPGSILIVGDGYLKVNKMKDDSGRTLNEGYPGDAVQVIGIPVVPKAGSIVYEVKDQKRAKFILNKKKQKHVEVAKQALDKPNVQLSSTKIKINNRRQRKAFCRGFSERWLQKYQQAQDKIVEQIQNLKKVQMTEQIMQLLIAKEDQLANHKKYVEQYLMNTKQKVNTLNLILKFSDRGIEETILEQIEKLAEKIKNNMGINLNILTNDVGQATLGDIKNAKLSNAEIITFGVGICSSAIGSISQYNITPKKHDLIHSFLKQIEDCAFKKKRSSIKGIERGNADVVEVFQIKKGKKGSVISVAGLKVRTGKLDKKGKFYVFRNGLPITQALYADFIKVFKNDVNDVKKNDECTLSLNGGESGIFQKGDQIYCFQE